MKKFISLFLALSMAFSVPIWANEKSYAEEYAKKAEELFDVTGKYEYSFSKDDHNRYFYTIRWENATVTFDGNGNIVDFYTYIDNSEDKSPNISKEQAEETATAKLKEIMGENAGKMRLETANYSYGNWNIVFYEYRNDYKVTYNSASITLNNKGKVISYNSDSFFDSEVQPYDSVLDYESAKNKYIKNVGFGKAYFKKSIGNGNKNILYACFAQKGRNNHYINASTGEKLDQISYDYLRGYGDYTADEKSLGYTLQSNNGLTEAEQNAVDKVKNTISPSQAMEVIKNQIGFEFTAEGLETHYFYDSSGNYYIGITNEKDNASAVVTDKGKLYMFSRYDITMNYYKEFSYDEQKEKALSVLNKTGYSDYELVDNEEYGLSNYFNFYKNVDGIINYADNITILTAMDGKIYSFYANESGLPLPSAESNLTVEDAFDKCEDNFGFTAKYIWNDRTQKGVLAYSFDTTPYLSLDGTPLDSSGNEYRPRGKKYTDIGNSPQKSYIEKLSEVGINYNSVEFKPDNILTYKDFTEFAPNFYTYNEFIYNPKKEYKDQDQLTKYDLAKFYCQIMGFSKLCKGDGFKTSYSDVTEEYVPYVAICESLGIFDKSSEFKGNSNVTREEFAKILWNFIKAYESFTGNNNYGLLE